MNEQDWRALAAQNPQRVTYPSWKPKEHWEAKRKENPWVPVEDNRNFWTRTKPHHAWERIVQRGWPGKPLTGLPVTQKLEPRPASWGKLDPRYYSTRRNSGL